MCLILVLLNMIVGARCVLCCVFGVFVCVACVFLGGEDWFGLVAFVIAQNECCEKNIMFHYDYFRNSIIK